MSLAKYIVKKILLSQHYIQLLENIKRQKIIFWKTVDLEKNIFIFKKTVENEKSWGFTKQGKTSRRM